MSVNLPDPSQLPDPVVPPPQENVERHLVRRVCEVFVLGLCLAFLWMVLRFGVRDSNTYALEPAGVALTDEGCLYLVWWANPGHTKKHVTHADTCKNEQHPARDTEWVLSHSMFTPYDEILKAKPKADQH